MAASTDSGSVTRRPLPIFAEIRRAQDAGYEQELRRALETLRGRTPRWLRLGAAVEGADSFFDAVAQGLKELRGAGGAAVSVVSLRSGCRDFAGAEGGGGSWLEASLRARGQKLRRYVRRVGNVASVAGEKAVRGSLEVEGKIIGEQHGVGLGVLELAEGLVTEQVVGDGRTGAVVRVAKYGGHYVPLLSSIEKDVRKKKEVPHDEVYGRDIQEDLHTTTDRKCRYSATHLVEEYCEPQLASIDKDVKKKKADQGTNFGRSLEEVVDITAGRKNMEEEHCLALFPSIEKKKKFSHGELYGRDVKENVHMTKDRKRRYSATPLVEEYSETMLACIEGVVKKKKKKKKKTDEVDIYRQDVVEIADLTTNRKCSHLSSSLDEEYFDPLIASADNIVKKKKKRKGHPGMIYGRGVKEVVDMTVDTNVRHLASSLLEEYTEPLPASIDFDVKKTKAHQGEIFRSNVDEVVDVSADNKENCVSPLANIEKYVKKKKIPHGEVNMEEVLHLTAHREHRNSASTLEEEYLQPFLINIEKDVKNKKKVDSGKIYGHNVEEVVDLTAVRKPMVEENRVPQLVSIMKDVKKKVEQGEIYRRDVEDIVDLTLEGDCCESPLASIDKAVKKRNKKFDHWKIYGREVEMSVDLTAHTKRMNSVSPLEKYVTHEKDSVDVDLTIENVVEEVNLDDEAEVVIIDDELELIGDSLKGTCPNVLTKMAKVIARADRSVTLRQLMQFFSTEGARKAISTLTRLGVSLASMASILSRAGLKAPQAFTDLYHLWVDERGQKTHYLQNLESRGVKLSSVTSILGKSGFGACKAFLDLYELWFDQKGNPTRYLTTLKKEKLKLTNLTSILSSSGVRGPKAFKELFNLWFDEEGKKTQYLRTLQKEGVNLPTMCSILNATGHKGPEAFVKLYNLWFDKQGAKSRYLISLEKQGIHLTHISSILTGVRSRAPEIFVQLYDLWFDVRGNKTRYLQTLEDGGINLTCMTGILFGAGRKGPECFISLYNLWFDRQGNKTQYLTTLEMMGINLSSVSNMLRSAGSNAAKAFTELFNLLFDGQGRKTKYLINLEQAQINFTNVSTMLSLAGSAAAQVFKEIYDLFFDERGNKSVYLKTLEKEGISFGTLSAVLTGTGAGVARVTKELYKLWFDENGNKRKYLLALEKEGVHIRDVCRALAKKRSKAVNVFKELNNHWLEQNGYKGQILEKYK